MKILPLAISAAILAPLLFAFVNKLDEGLIKKTQSSWGLVMFSSLFGIVSIILSLIFVVVQGSSLIIPLNTIIILLVSGFLEIIWLYWYLESLEYEEVSSVTTWFQIVPVFVAILSAIFLKEVISTNVWIGIIIAVIGSAILGYDWSSKSLWSWKWKPMMLMIGAAGLIAIGSVLYKIAAIDNLPFWVSMFWLHVGLFSTGVFLVLFKKKRIELVTMLRMNGTYVLRVSVLNEVCNLSGLLLILYASYQAPLHIVYTLSTLQPVFVLLFTWVFIQLRFEEKNQSFTPKIATIMKIVAIGMMIVSGIFIF